MCDCNGVFGDGCIEGEGDCDSDDQCLQATSDETKPSILGSVLPMKCTQRDLRDT